MATWLGHRTRAGLGGDGSDEVDLMDDSKAVSMVDETTTAKMAASTVERNAVSTADKKVCLRAA